MPPLSHFLPCTTTPTSITNPPKPTITAPPSRDVTSHLSWGLPNGRFSAINVMIFMLPFARSDITSPARPLPRRPHGLDGVWRKWRKCRVKRPDENVSGKSGRKKTPVAAGKMAGRVGRCWFPGSAWETKFASGFFFFLFPLSFLPFSMRIQKSRKIIIILGPAPTEYGRNGGDIWRSGGGH